MGDPIINEFRRLVNVEVEEFVAASKAFNSLLMENLATMVIRAFEAEFTFVYEGIRRDKPENEYELKRLTEPIFEILRKVIELVQGNKHSEEYSNHLSTVGESILALSWITAPQTPAQYIRDMKEIGDYYGNRVLTAYKGKELHSTWINKWNAVMTGLENYVKRFHPCGFVWNLAGTYNRPASFYLPPGIPPPPPPAFFGLDDASDAPAASNKAAAADRLAAAQQLLMRDINQGPDIVRSLRPVNQSAHRRSAAPAPRSAAQKDVAPAPSHAPVFAAEGKKWRVEYHKNVQSLELNPTDKSESLAMYKCEKISLETKAKMNAVTIDNCKRCVVILQHIISSVELIRCERLEIRCMGSCPNITLDSCDSVQVFLSDSSANCEVISSKSTSTNVCRLTEDGDYVEFPVPEQIRSVLVDNKLQSSIVEHCM